MDWLPLIIAAVIGIIIGAIATVIPYRRRGEEFQYRIRDLESKLKKADTDLNDVRGQVQTITANWRNTEASLSDAKTQITSLTDAKNALDASLSEAQAQIGALTDEKNSLTTNLADATNRVAALNDEKSALDVALVGMTAQAAALRKDYDAKITTLSGDLDGATAEIGTLRSNAEATAQALSAKESELAEAQTSLGNTKLELDTLSNLKSELEGKLAHARADVAAELALLTSTMIKMKEEALSQANARINALNTELSSLKSNKSED